MAGSIQSRNSVEVERYSVWFVVVVALFITCLITANIVAVKIVDIGGVILPAAVLIFPVSYIIGDVLTEVYGYRQARRVIWLGFGCNLLVVLAIWVSQLLPAASFWDGQIAFERILGFTPRLLIASFVAYLIGEFANSYVLSRMKVATRGRWLWMRTIGSTVVGQGIDSLVFIYLAFSGLLPWPGLIWMVVSQWLVKSLYEAAVTPITYLVVNYLKKREGVDIFDRSVRFTPWIWNG